MLEEMLHKETNHECDNRTKIRHFLPGHETCSQTSSIKNANLTGKNLEMQSFGLCKNC